MKKIVIVYGMGFCLLVLLTAPRALPDTAADLKHVEELRQAGQYAQTEQICQSILQREPNNPEAVYQAGKMLPRLYLAMDRLPHAQEAVLQLLACSAGHEQLPHALHEIIEQAGSSRVSELDFCHFGVAESALFSEVSHVTAGFLRSIVSAMEADKSANTRFFQYFFISGVAQNGKSRVKKLFSEYVTSKNLPMAALHIGRGDLSFITVRKADVVGAFPVPHAQEIVRQRESSIA